MPDSNPPIFDPDNFDPDNAPPPGDLEDLEQENPDLMPTQTQKKQWGPYHWAILALTVSAIVLLGILVRSIPSDRPVQATVATASGLTETVNAEGDEPEVELTEEAATKLAAKTADPAKPKPTQAVDFAAVYEGVIKPAYKELRDEQKRLAAEIKSLEKTHDRTVRELEIILIVVTLLFAVALWLLTRKKRIIDIIVTDMERGLEKDEVPAEPPPA